MKKLPAFLLAASLPLAVPAFADTVYISQAAFNAATNSVTNVGFDGIATTNGYVNEGYTYAVGGASFSSTNYLNVVGANYYPYTYPANGYATYDDGGYLDISQETTGQLVITFAASTAVGLGGLFGPNMFTITLSDGTVYTESAPDSITGTGALDFVGFTSSTPITSITVSEPGTENHDNDNEAWDNIQFGTANPVAAPAPEPAAIALLATGLCGVHGLRRRARSR